MFKIYMKGSASNFLSSREQNLVDQLHNYRHKKNA